MLGVGGPGTPELAGLRNVHRYRFSPITVVPEHPPLPISPFVHAGSSTVAGQLGRFCAETITAAARSHDCHAERVAGVGCCGTS